MAFLRFTRDPRGYEHFYLVEPSTNRRGKSRPRVLYWFRTPPNVKVGREPFDSTVRRALEAQNPGVEFDWKKILETPIPSVEAEKWRERRRSEKAEKAARRAASAAEEGSDTDLVVSDTESLEAPINNLAGPGSDLAPSDTYMAVSDTAEPVSDIDSVVSDTLDAEADEEPLVPHAIEAAAERSTASAPAEPGLAAEPRRRRRRRRRGRRGSRPVEAPRDAGGPTETPEARDSSTEPPPEREGD